MPERGRSSPPSSRSLRRLGLELYDVEITGSGRARTLRVLVDRDGGVDLEAITAAPRRIRPCSTPTWRRHPGPYLLEVSSPGLERPLRTAGALPARRRRRPSRSRPAAPTARPAACRGVLVAADDDGVEVDDRRREREHVDVRPTIVAGAHGVRVGPGAEEQPEAREARRRQKEVAR